jgi:predicted nucleic acid-binding protein
MNSMTSEFVDTNILLYAHDGAAGRKHVHAVALLERLLQAGRPAISTQVLGEFYSAATTKLGRKSEEVAQTISDMGEWIIHRPTHADILQAIRVRTRYKIGWWDAMILTSAIETGCSVLWTEDFNDGQRYGGVTARNPFAA